MPLPTFTIVMGVLTCVPFGLAIRDTVKGVERPLTQEERIERDLAKFRAEREARELEYEQAEQKLADERAAKHKTAIGMLVGKERATLGSAFAGAKLGGSQDDLEALAGKLEQIRSRYELDLAALGDAHTFQSIYIKPTMRYDEAGEFCETLEETLEGAWGDGRLDANDRTIWLDQGNGQRAIFNDSDGCELTIERFAPLASWFSKGQESIVPLWAIGQPIKRLESLLGDRASAQDNGTVWAGLGIGNGIGATSLRAIVRNGKIVAIVTSAETDSTTQDELYKHISAVMGKEPEWEDASFVWKTKPRLELEQGSAQLMLTVGTLPDED
jgi:hypothetical protein